jgi:glucose uptake protein GlcU
VASSVLIDKPYFKTFQQVKQKAVLAIQNSRYVFATTFFAVPRVPALFAVMLGVACLSGAEWCLGQVCDVCHLKNCIHFDAQTQTAHSAGSALPDISHPSVVLLRFALAATSR